MSSPEAVDALHALGGCSHTPFSPLHCLSVVTSRPVARLVYPGFSFLLVRLVNTGSSHGARVVTRAIASCAAPHTHLTKPEIHLRSLAFTCVRTHRAPIRTHFTALRRSAHTPHCPTRPDMHLRPAGLRTAIDASALLEIAEHVAACVHVTDSARRGDQQTARTPVAATSGDGVSAGAASMSGTVSSSAVVDKAASALALRRGRALLAYLDRHLAGLFEVKRRQRGGFLGRLGLWGESPLSHVLPQSVAPPLLPFPPSLPPSSHGRLRSLPLSVTQIRAGTVLPCWRIFTHTHAFSDMSVSL
jgi:hypothetical protein